MPKFIEEIQKEIVSEFEVLEGDQDMTLEYLIDLGQKLPKLDDIYKVESNMVKGCQSKVWLVADAKGDNIYFQADSNTVITKGLVSLLVRILSSQQADDIINTDINFPSKIGMSRFIGTQRTNGFTSMIKQMKIHAFSLKQRLVNKN